MMPRFMSYQIVILNGERRGERMAIGHAAVTLGGDPTCSLQLPDRGLCGIHAEITRQKAGLQIRACTSTHPLWVNKTMVQESSLKHGDVVELGATRLFIQAQSSTGKWEKLSTLRQGLKKTLSVGLSSLLLAGIILTIYRCQPEHPPPDPGQDTRRYTPPAADTNNTDWMVTNVPPIEIHNSIILTAAPPDVIEAGKAFSLNRTNNIHAEIEAALKELESATEFINAARQHPMVPLPGAAATNQTDITANERIP